MTRVATIVPAESDLLCEGCGYTLNGLPETGRCPECGKAIAESIGSDRVLPAWEQVTARGREQAFAQTTCHVIFHPTRFYRTLATRRDERASARFAHRHWYIATFFFALGATFHLKWYNSLYLTGIARGTPTVLFWFITMVACYLVLWATTELAARLTHWEATYRGLRLPLQVVRRGLYYHAAHYFPVGIIAAITVLGYCWLVYSRILGVQSAVYYLYVLCAEVILAAGYLFKTYWIAMKNMMFANR